MSGNARVDGIDNLSPVLLGQAQERSCRDIAPGQRHGRPGLKAGVLAAHSPCNHRETAELALGGTELVGVGVHAGTAYLDIVRAGPVVQVATQVALLGQDFVCISFFARPGRLAERCPGSALGVGLVGEPLTGGIEQVLTDGAQGRGQVVPGPEQAAQCVPYRVIFRVESDLHQPSVVV